MKEFFIKTGDEQDQYFNLCRQYNVATFNNNVQKGFEIIVENLKWYNENK